MADIRDEHGNPIQLTDQHGNPVRLTDEHGNPMHLTGVATSQGSGMHVEAPLADTVPEYGKHGGEDRTATTEHSGPGGAPLVEAGGEVEHQQGQHEGTVPWSSSSSSSSVRFIFY